MITDTTRQAIDDWVNATRQAIDELWALFRETDRKIAQSNQETDRKFQETDRRIAQSSKETDRRIEKSIGSLSNKWGTFVEYFLAPGIPRVFQERGLPIYRIYQRAKSNFEGKDMEIDILGANGDFVLLVSIKSTLSVDDVNEHLEDIENFKKFFPEYVNKKAIGAVAGIEITGKADKYAYKKGLFVIGQSGDSIKIINDKKFKPKEW